MDPHNDFDKLDKLLGINEFADELGLTDKGVEELFDTDKTGGEDTSWLDNLDHPGFGLKPKQEQKPKGEKPDTAGTANAPADQQMSMADYGEAQKKAANAIQQALQQQLMQMLGHAAQPKIQMPQESDVLRAPDGTIIPAKAIYEEGNTTMKGKKQITCKQCGQGNLIWWNNMGQWELWPGVMIHGIWSKDMSGSRHLCGNQPVQQASGVAGVNPGSSLLGIACDCADAQVLWGKFPEGAKLPVCPYCKSFFHMLTTEEASTHALI